MRMNGIFLIALVLASHVLASEQKQKQHAGSDVIDDVAATLDENMGILNEALLSERPQELRKAAHTVGVLRKQLDESARLVERLLSDSRPAVRIAAVDALLNFRDPALIHLFVKALSDHEPRVQCRAVIGICRLLPRHGFAGSLEEQARAKYVADWYEREIQETKQRSVRGLLAFACEQRSEEVSLAIPILAKSVGGGDDHLCGELWLLLLSQSTSQALGRCLSDTDASIRRGAARMLLELETEDPTARETLDAAEAITAGLSDSDPEVRLYCLLTLTRHEEADLNLITQLASDADPTVRCAAVEALVRPTDAVEVLCKVAASDTSSRVRVRAAFALASCAVSDAEVTELLARRFTSEQTPGIRALLDMGIAYHGEYWDEEDAEHAPHVQDVGPAIASVFEAISQERARPLPDRSNTRFSDGFDSMLLAALGACGPAARQAVPQILQDLTELTSLGSGDLRVDMENWRLNSCLYALARIGPTPALADALEHRNPVVRTMAAMALAGRERFAARAVPVLVDSLNRDCWGRCVYSHTLRTDVTCLARFGHRAVPALLTLLRDNRNVVLAREALSLMELDAPRVVPLLLPVLNDSDEPLQVRVAVVDVLGSVGVKESRAYRALANVLLNRNEAESVRVAAAKSLAGNQAGDTMMVLRKVTDDPSQAVRQVAEEAIRRIEATR